MPGAGPPVLDEASFEAEALAFLRAHADERPADAFAWGQGDDTLFRLLEEQDEGEEEAAIEAAHVWRLTKADRNFAWVDGPTEYGGRALPRSYALAFRALERRFDVPDERCFFVGVELVGPTILAYGSEGVQRRYLPALYRGDMLACQLFSEPDAGSDLASLRTTAVRDGDEWVVHGQKIWTSFAHRAGIGELVCRTDPAAPKHAGCTAFVVDMRAPGVHVRPIRQMTGGASFNEVFLDGVRVPDDHRLGEVGAGWTVASTTLAYERAALGGDGVIAGDVDFGRLAALVSRFAPGDAVVRDELARLYSELTLLRLTGERTLARLRAGDDPGAEMSLAKLHGARTVNAVAALLSQVLGPRLVADTGEWGTYAQAHFVLSVPAARIAGGTDEIMRNIVAERLLGLPREPRTA